MDFNIELGQTIDIDDLELLYNELNDYLEKEINYPGWKKGIYPVRENASIGVEKGTLFVAKQGGRIIGSIILNHEPEAAYYHAEWGIDSDYTDVIVIHTFAVHPNFMKSGVGKALMDFACEYGTKLKMKSIRLDVYEKNIPAISLYEKCGFEYIGKVDLGLGDYGLHWFKLYEKILTGKYRK